MEGGCVWEVGRMDRMQVEMETVEEQLSGSIPKLPADLMASSTWDISVEKTHKAISIRFRRIIWAVRRRLAWARRRPEAGRHRMRVKCPPERPEFTKGQVLDQALGPLTRLKKITGRSHILHK